MGWSFLGKGLAIQGRLEDAAAAFDEAQRLGKLSASALETYADTLLRLGQFKKAENILAPIVQGATAKGAGIFFGQLASALNGQKRYQDADRAFAQAMKRLPMDSTVALNRGVNALQHGDPARAGILWNQALELDPLNNQARRELIRLHRANQAMDEVQNLAVEGNRLLPRYGYYLLEIARISAASEPYLTAYTRYNKAIAAQGDLVVAYIELAALAKKNEEDVVARDIIERGRRAAPRYPGWGPLIEKYKLDTIGSPTDVKEANPLHPGP